MSNAAAIKEWKQKDNAARLFIVSTVDLQQQRSLINCKSAEDMWARLCCQFEMVAAENKHILLQRFFEYPYQQEHDVLAHITAIESMACQLRDVGAEISEDQTISKIICTLPPSFRHVIAAWENVEENKKKLPLLTARLLKAEAMGKQHGEVDPADTAFFARRFGSSVMAGASNKSSNGDSRGQKNRRHRCEYCGKAGHEEARCWTREKDLKKEAALTREAAQANIASGNSSDWPADYAFISLSSQSDYAFTSSLAPVHRELSDWYADSGASQHMSDQIWMFRDFHPVAPGSWPVRGIGTANAPLQVFGVGNIPMKTKVKGRWNTGVLLNVIYVPSLGANLFSIKSATGGGAICTFSDNDVIVTRAGKTVATGSSFQSKLYRLDIKATQPTDTKPPARSALAHLSTTTAQPLNIWHQRLGHVSHAKIKEMEKANMVDGLAISPHDVDPFCEGCIYGKQHRLPFPTLGRTRARQIAELIHSDVCGPMSTPSPNGARYFVLFTDDYSGYSTIFFMKEKREVANKLKEYVAGIERVTEKTVKHFRSDNGGEFVGKELGNWLKERGIQHQTSAPYTPEQNGVSERKNRTVVEAARSMLSTSGLPRSLWAEACNCAVYVLNRIHSRASPEENKTPFELWFGKKPNLSHLRIFGSDAYVHVPDCKRTKFEPKSTKCHLVGYCEAQKAFRLWDSVEKKVTISRDVIFHELTVEPTEAPSFSPTAQDTETTQQEAVELADNQACEEMCMVQEKAVILKPMIDNVRTLFADPR